MQLNRDLLFPFLICSFLRTVTILHPARFSESHAVFPFIFFFVFLLGSFRILSPEEFTFEAEKLGSSSKRQYGWIWQWRQRLPEIDLDALLLVLPCVQPLTDHTLYPLRRGRNLSPFR